MATKRPRIRRIELTPLLVPFRAHVKMAMAGPTGELGMAIPAEEEWLGGDFVICKVTAEDGSEGLGEAFMWLPQTGVTPSQMIETVAKGLANYVLGQTPFDIEARHRRMDNNVARNDVAKGLIDMACYDLMGHIAGLPAHDFLGGRTVDTLPLCALVPLIDPDTMAFMSQGFVYGGHPCLRLKLGEDVESDVAIVKKVREAVGPKIRIRVDYNQAYTAEMAIRSIKAIEPYGIDVAEQPVRANDILGMVRVQQAVDMPLMSHEGAFTLREIVEQVELGAIRVVAVNSERPGGVTNAVKAIDYAARRGMGVVLHNQPLGIASAMHVHLAAARFNDLGHPMELVGDVMMEDDLIKEPLDYSNGHVKVPEGPGWGVALDTDALGKYAKGPTVVVEVKNK